MRDLHPFDDITPQERHRQSRGAFGKNKSESLRLASDVRVMKKIQISCKMFVIFLSPDVWTIAHTPLKSKRIFKKFLPLPFPENGKTRRLPCFVK